MQLMHVEGGIQIYSDSSVTSLDLPMVRWQMKTGQIYEIITFVEYEYLRARMNIFDHKYIFESNDEDNTILSMQKDIYQKRNITNSLLY